MQLPQDMLMPQSWTCIHTCMRPLRAAVKSQSTTRPYRGVARRSLRDPVRLWCARPGLYRLPPIGALPARTARAKMGREIA